MLYSQSKCLSALLSTLCFAPCPSLILNVDQHLAEKRKNGRSGSSSCLDSNYTYSVLGGDHRRNRLAMPGVCIRAKRHETQIGPSSITAKLAELWRCWEQYGRSGEKGQPYFLPSNRKTEGWLGDGNVNNAAAKMTWGHVLSSIFRHRSVYC